MTLIIIGAGGHGRVCAEIADSLGIYASIVFSDRPERKGGWSGSWAIAYTDDDLPDVAGEGFHAFIGVGQTKLGSARADLFGFLTGSGFRIPSLVSPAACVSRHAEVGTGTLIGIMAAVNHGAKVGMNCIINTKALIEHDAVVEDHVHVSTAAVVNGGCRVGSRSLIGSNAVISNGIRICDDVLVGAGAVVVKDIHVPGTYVGVPAERVEHA